MFVLLLTAVLNIAFPQILELMSEDRVALCMGQMEVRMALTYWILSSSVQREVTAHKKIHIICLNQIPFKARDQVQCTGEKRVNFLGFVGISGSCAGVRGGTAWWWDGKVRGHAHGS